MLTISSEFRTMQRKYQLTFSLAYGFGAVKKEKMPFLNEANCILPQSFFGWLHEKLKLIRHLHVIRKVVVDTHLRISHGQIDVRQY